MDVAEVLVGQWVLDINNSAIFQSYDQLSINGHGLNKIITCYKYGNLEGFRLFLAY